MSTALNQIIDDTSPVVTYTPSISTDPFTDDVGAQKAQEEGWIVQFDNKNFLVGASVLGNGTSDHLTSRDGAGFGFDFTGKSYSINESFISLATTNVHRELDNATRKSSGNDI